VLYVLRYYPTLSETFVYREMAEIVARGVTVHAMAIGSRPDGRLQDELPPVDVRYPPQGFRGGAVLFGLARALGSRDGRWAWRWANGNMRTKDAARACWLAIYASEIGASRLHAHFAGEAAEWARVAGAILGIPYTVTVHAVDLFRPRPTLSVVLRDADRVIVIAEHHRHIIADRYRVESQVVRCGVDPSRYAAANPGTEGPLRVVSVARNVPKKGLPLLARAVDSASVPMSLRLVSDAPALRSDRVRPGQLPPSMVGSALEQAHLFALPCRIADNGDRDGLPVSLLEAMAAGLPVLTTPIAGIPEVVDEQVGWLVPPDDRSALQRALEEIAAHPKERARRGRAARERIVERGLTVKRQADALLGHWGMA